MLDEDELSQGARQQRLKMPLSGACIQGEQKRFPSCLNMIGAADSPPTPEAGRTTTSTTASYASSSFRGTSMGPLVEAVMVYPAYEYVADPSALGNGDSTACGSSETVMMAWDDCTGKFWSSEVGCICDIEALRQRRSWSAQKRKQRRSKRAGMIS